MNMKEEQIVIEDLWNSLVAEGREVHSRGTYEVIDGNGIKVLAYGTKYVPVVWLSRHKTPKHLVKIIAASGKKT